MKGSATRGSLAVLFALTGAILLIASCVGTEDYKGDGKVTVIQRFPALSIRVDFDDFSLAEPFDRTYSIRGLPDLNYAYLVGLAVSGEVEDSVWPPPALKYLRGSIRCEVRTSGGVTIFRSVGTTGDLFWTGLEGDVPFGYVSGTLPGGSSRIRPREVPAGDELDQLFVSYIPEPGQEALIANVRMMADCFR